MGFDGIATSGELMVRCPMPERQIPCSGFGFVVEERSHAVGAFVYHRRLLPRNRMLEKAVDTHGT